MRIRRIGTARFHRADHFIAEPVLWLLNMSRLIGPDSAKWPIADVAHDFVNSVLKCFALI
jgi:hypothetical protein